MPKDSNDRLKSLREHDAAAAREQARILNLRIQCRSFGDVDKLTLYFNTLVEKVAGMNERLTKQASLPYLEARCAGIIEQIEALSKRVEKLEEAKQKKGEGNMKGRMEDIEGRVTAIEQENATWHK